MLAQLVEENRMGEVTNWAAPPMVNHFDNEVEVGLGHPPDLHATHLRRFCAGAQLLLDAGARRHQPHPMPSQVRIAPSILSADFARLGEEVQALESAGADWIHVDVMDGRFVPNLTIGPPVVKALRRVTTLPLDVHLMIVEPERMIDAFADAGADCITVHVEACTHVHRAIQHIQARGLRAGVSLNPSTSEEAVRYLIPSVDLILVMSVNPGFGGQAFIADVVPKIDVLRKWITASGRSIDIEVDGGIGPRTAAVVCEAGANVLVAGNAIFGGGNYARAIAELRNAAKA